MLRALLQIPAQARHLSEIDDGGWLRVTGGELVIRDRLVVDHVVGFANFAARADVESARAGMHVGQVITDESEAAGVLQILRAREREPEGALLILQLAALCD